MFATPGDTRAADPAGRLSTRTGDRSEGGIGGPDPRRPTANRSADHPDRGRAPRASRPRSGAVGKPPPRETSATGRKRPILAG